jgi:hypothetical protein
MKCIKINRKRRKKRIYKIMVKNEFEELEELEKESSLPIFVKKTI